MRVRHTPRTFFTNQTAPRRGIEPRPAVSMTAMQSGTLAGHTSRNRKQYPDLDSNQDLNLRRVRCDPLHHRDARQSRRPDSRRHGAPCYRITGKTGAFLSRATSAKARAQGVEPRGAALETACSPRSTLVCRRPRLDPSAPLGSSPCQRSYSVSSVTFQYASLTNFDQLAIRTEGEA